MFNAQVFPVIQQDRKSACKTATSKTGLPSAHVQPGILPD